MYDSCPSYPNPDLMTRGFSQVVSAKFNNGKPAEMPMVNSMVRKFFEYYFNKPEMQLLSDIVKNSLQHDVPAHANQMYLTSAGDELVYASETHQHVVQQAEHLTEMFATEQRTRSEYDMNSASQLLNEYLLLHKDAARYVLDPKLRMARSDEEVRSVLTNSVTENFNNRIFYKDFVTSSHVDHLRKHPEEYRKLVHAFMQYCFRL